MKTPDKNIQTVKIYDEIAEKYAKIFDKDLSDIPFIKKFLTYVKPKGKILDLGCGTGRITSEYVKKGFDSIGVDLSEKMIDIAKKNHPKIKFICKNMRKIEFKPESFEAISLAYSLFHLEKRDVPAFLKKISVFLKKEGILFMVIQEGEGEVFINEPLATGKKLFLNLYSEKEIIRILEDEKFQILSISRKKSELKGELPYNKLIIIAKKT